VTERSHAIHITNEYKTTHALCGHEYTEAAFRKISPIAIDPNGVFPDLCEACWFAKKHGPSYDRYRAVFVVLELEDTTQAFFAPQVGGNILGERGIASLFFFSDMEDWYTGPQRPNGPKDVVQEFPSPPDVLKMNIWALDAVPKKSHLGWDDKEDDDDET